MTSDSQNIPGFGDYDKDHETEAYLKVTNYKNSIFEAVNEAKHYIYTHDCKKLNIDISGLNLIDAMKVCVLSSTYHFAKYPDGKIRWFVKDERIKEQICLLKLDNTEIEIKHVRKSYVDTENSFAKRFHVVR